MSLPLIPHIRVPIAGASVCADPWYTWLQAVQRQVAVSVDVDSLVSEIATKLGSPDGSIAGIPTPSEATGNVLGLKSLQSFGTLAEGQVTLTLRGDVNVPGVTEYYGSNATGQRGWHPVGDAMTQGVGLALTVGTDGVTTFDLAELPDTGIGAALVKTTRDAYGRVEGTEAATTDDLTEGANLYFTDERARAAVVAASITDGDTTHAPSGDAVADALAGKANLAGGNTISEKQNLTGKIVLNATGVEALTSSNTNPDFQLTGTVPAAANPLIGIWSNDTFGSAFYFLKSRNGTVGGHAAVQNGDALGGFIMEGSNGTAMARASQLRVAVDGSVGANVPGEIQLRTTNASGTLATRWVSRASGTWEPGADNAYDLGRSGARIREVFAANGTINTSDAREKDLLRDLSPDELAASLDLARLHPLWKWIAAVAEKGEDLARWHCGPTVQDCIAVMESHGLDPFGYGFVCYDQWPEQQEVVESWPEERDDEGNVTREAGSEIVKEYRPAGDRYSLRPSELEAFCRRGMMQKIDSMDARLTALGG